MRGASAASEKEEFHGIRARVRRFGDELYHPGVVPALGAWITHAEVEQDRGDVVRAAGLADDPAILAATDNGPPLANALQEGREDVHGAGRRDGAGLDGVEEPAWVFHVGDGAACRAFGAAVFDRFVRQDGRRCGRRWG